MAFDDKILEDSKKLLQEQYFPSTWKAPLEAIELKINK